MNKQIAIFATTCLVVSLVMAANILPRVLAQVTGELEKQVQSKHSITNATKNQKVTTFPVICDGVPSQGEKWEDQNCKMVTNQTVFMALCSSEAIQAKNDLEKGCDLKPIR